MDSLWDTVRANPGELLPCLRAALADPKTDPWFRFDGSNLLVTIDPSPESKAFNAYVNGDGRPFQALVSEVSDGERDVVAVLNQEDVSLVRKVRRKMIANANQHAFEFYKTFTDILMTLVWRPELVK